MDNKSSFLNKAMDYYLDLHEWQLTHIQQGVEAAQKRNFASDKEVKDFFEKYGDSLYPETK